MCRRFLIRTVFVALSTFWTVAGFGQEPKPRVSEATPLGFAPERARLRPTPKALALAVPTPDAARGWLRRLTQEPHVAGTEADHKTALFVRDKLRSWGWTADLAEYEVLLNYGIGVPKLELLRPTKLKLPLIEKTHRADKDASGDVLNTVFHGYGVSGRSVQRRRLRQLRPTGRFRRPSTGWASTSKTRSCWSVTARSFAA